VRRGFHHTVQQWDQVVLLLKEKWSPEQISNCLKLHGPFSISHETIYKYILPTKERVRCYISANVPKVRKALQLQGFTRSPESVIFQLVPMK
jgi:IS30 family transposase